MSQAATNQRGHASEGTDDVAGTIRGAESHDVVFAVIGHAGAGATHVATTLCEGLQSKGRTAHLLKMSRLIEEAARKADAKLWANTSSTDRLVRARALQDAGNWLREKKGSAFTAGLAVRAMHELRDQRAPNNGPLAFVIDCLKK